MGKHAAAEGSSADPIVAAALAARPTETGGAHFADSARPDGENPLGWPAEPEMALPGDVQASLV